MFLGPVGVGSGGGGGDQRFSGLVIKLRGGESRAPEPLPLIYHIFAL